MRGFNTDIGKIIKRMILGSNFPREKTGKIKYIRDFGKIMKEMDMEF